MTVKILRKTGCDQYEWFEGDEREIMPQEIGHSDEPIPVEIPEMVPVEVG